MRTPELSLFADAELCSLRLDGHVVDCRGLTMCVDTVTGMEARLSALRALVPDGTVVILEGALWVWGYLPLAPKRILVTSLTGRRLHGLPSRFHAIEIHVSPSDAVSLDGVHVTTRSRTLGDIARFVHSDQEASRLIAILAGPGSTLVADALAALTTHAPYAARARSRLRAHLTHAIDVIDAVNPSDGVQQSFQM